MNKKRLGVVSISQYQAPSDEFIKKLLNYLQVTDCVWLGDGMMLIESIMFDEVGLNDRIPMYHPLPQRNDTILIVNSKYYSQLIYINFE